MAKHNEIFERRKEILAFLKKEKEVHLQNIQEKLGIGKRTVLSDIAALRKCGNVIKINSDICRLELEADVSMNSSRAIARRLKIILLISEEKNGVTQEKLLKKVLEDTIIQGDENDIIKKKETVRKDFLNDIKHLIAENVIYIREKVIYTSISTSKIIKADDNYLLEIYEMLINYSKECSYNPILSNVMHKLEDVIRYKMYGEVFDEYQTYAVRNNRRNILAFERNIEKLFKYSFKDKSISITSRNRYGNEFTTDLNVEKLIYLSDTGQVYIVGRELEYGNRMVIELQRVLDIKKLDFNNTIYNNAEINLICEEMIRISVEEPKEVKIVFDRKVNENMVFHNYISSRKNARMNYSGDKVEYIDVIRGNDDFAKKMRIFGMECISIEDKELKERLLRSCKRMIQRYEE